MKKGKVLRYLFILTLMFVLSIVGAALCFNTYRFFAYFLFIFSFLCVFGQMKLIFSLNRKHNDHNTA